MVPFLPALSPAWRRLLCGLVAVLLAPFALPVSPRAQDTPSQDTDWSGDVPAHIAVVDGTASLERDGRVVAAEENVPLLAGDRLRTDDGRVEILFADGSALDIDTHAAVDLLSESLLRLRAGRIRLSIVRVTDALDYRVDGAGVSALVRAAGEYRLSMSDARAVEPELDLAVIHGTAELAGPAGRTLVRAGTHAFASERTEPSLPYMFNSSGSTAFDRWADDQRDARLGTQSAQYLPAETRYYGGTLEQNGTWQYEPTYGTVWFPRVAADWRPYYDGRWCTVGSFGWVWIGAERWSWPTHHYGRWGVTAGRWFWIPDRRWGPAWVSWAVSPTYVSWCPLGFDGRPAVAPATPTRYGDARHAWTVVPARTFAADVAVPRHAVANQMLPPTAWSEFAPRAAGPTVVGPRSRAEPLRAPTAGRGRVGVVVTMPVPLQDARRGSRSLTPPSPEAPGRPASPRAPADPTRPRGGSTQPPVTVLPVYVVPSRGRSGPPPAPPAPADPNSTPASPGSRRVAPPAPSLRLGPPAPSVPASTPPATPPARARGAGSTPPASTPPAPNSTASGRRRGGGD